MLAEWVLLSTEPSLHPQNVFNILNVCFHWFPPYGDVKFGLLSWVILIGKLIVSLITWFLLAVSNSG